MKETSIKLSDGRKMGIAEFGPNDGYPIIYCSGTPSSRFDPIAIAIHDIVSSQSQVNVRIVLIERPGYGLSSEAEYYSLEKWGEDVEEVTNQLGIDRFSVIGVSGGGPFALAISALLASKVDKVAVIAGMGPIAIPNWYELLSSSHKDTATAALHDPAKIEAYIADIHNDPKAFTENVLSRLPETDRAKLPQSLVDRYIQDKGEASKKAFGMINDYRVFQQPWPFSITDIKVPLAFWHGDQDEAVPPEYSTYLAAQSEYAQVEIKEGYSHFSIMLAALPEVFAFFMK